VRRKVVFRPEAESDLDDIFEFIAHDSYQNALNFTERIRACCEQLGDFPERGTVRDDLGGLRTIGFERRVTIAFRVLSDRVQIVDIFYGGRDFERILKDQSF
jgi:toxin ParE1/3/4